ncbi:hypothetical protein [Candidatus Nitrotoga fabula]|uniref:Uncharacterized protein n=1 Tax=Candidatus Nitrotoga fabula TaxID=2182327 RepID=A0A916BED4_9PROT|nr:hypothetical protein [Candidatus Nitrotoga fabula]CAE6729267.1 hypothetical protein NTGZN8_40058 [Candidatus Nitrotoga fabula]
MKCLLATLMRCTAASFQQNSVITNLVGLKVWLAKVILMILMVTFFEEV